MNIVKSLHAGVLYRNFTFNRQHVFAASALWGFELDTGKPVLEQDLWEAVGEALANGSWFDAGMPKSRAEFLVYGHFHAPDGKPVGSGRVGVAVGQKGKVLDVHGDRYWTSTGLVGPVPTTKIPVSYRHAFGGSDFKDNPEGVGMAISTRNAEERHWLPNVEYPDDRVSGPGSRVRPAALDRVDLTWEPRQRLAGTYDEEYLRTAMPGLADDLNWDFFNDGAPDQWLDDFLQGDEPWVLENLHPQHPKLSGRLPGIRARVFIERIPTPVPDRHQTDEDEVRPEPEPEWLELPLKLDTVWFFPDQNLGILIHRGTIASDSFEGSDIRKLLIAHENAADEPRPDGHYQTEMARRTDPKKGAIYTFNTLPLIPEGCPCGFAMLTENSGQPLEMLALQNMQNYGEQQQNAAITQAEAARAQAMESLAQSGVDPRAIAPEQAAAVLDGKASIPDDPDVAALKELIDRIAPGARDKDGKVDLSQVDFAALDELQGLGERMRESRTNQVRELLLEQIDTLTREQGDVVGMQDALASLRERLADLDRPPMLPRNDLRAQQKGLAEAMEKLEEQVALGRAMGDSQVDDATLKRYRTDMAAMDAQLAANEKALRDGYRQGAHRMGECRSPHPGREAHIARDLLMAMRRAQPVAGGDYAFTDLRGADLRGVDLSDAYLEYADLTDADLTGANLENAILAHATLCRTRLGNACLRGANLGASHIEDADLSGCDLEGATFGLANLVRARLLRVHLPHAMEAFLDTRFDGVDFSGADLSGGHFIERDLSGCCFAGARLDGVSFLNCQLRSADFSGASLTGTNLVEADCSDARFTGALLDNTRFVSACDLRRTRWQGALATGANFREADLRAADLSQGQFPGCDFSGANLTKASARGAAFVRAQFFNARVIDADLRSANLMEASLLQAWCQGTDFRDSNCYSVSFLKATLGDNRFHGADLTNTLLKDWRP